VCVCVGVCVHACVCGWVCVGVCVHACVCGWVCVCGVGVGVCVVCGCGVCVCGVCACVGGCVWCVCVWCGCVCVCVRLRVCVHLQCLKDSPSCMQIHVSCAIRGHPQPHFMFCNHLLRV